MSRPYEGGFVLPAQPATSVCTFCNWPPPLWNSACRDGRRMCCR